MIETIALVASIALPLTNIPMIIKSLSASLLRLFPVVNGTMGVLGVSCGRVPSGLHSHDIVWKTFCVANIVLFTGLPFAHFFIIERESNMELFKMAKEAMAMRGRLAEMEKVLKSKIFKVQTKLNLPRLAGPGARTKLRKIAQLHSAGRKKISGVP